MSPRELEERCVTLINEHGDDRYNEGLCEGIKRIDFILANETTARRPKWLWQTLESHRKELIAKKARRM